MARGICLGHVIPTPRGNQVEAHYVQQLPTWHMVLIAFQMMVTSVNKRANIFCYLCLCFLSALAQVCLLA